METKILSNSTKVILAFILTVGCRPATPPKTDFQELLEHSARMGWSADEMKIDTVSEGKLAVSMYRFSNKIMSDWHVFYPDGQFKSYYFYPGPDHYFELSINRRKPNSGDAYLETSKYWGLLLLSPKSAANEELEQCVVAAAPSIGECWIKLLDERSTEIPLENRLEKPEAVNSFLEFLGVDETTNEVSFEWFWKHLSPEGSSVEIRNSIKLFRNLGYWEVEKYNPLND